MQGLPLGCRKGVVHYRRLRDLENLISAHPGLTTAQCSGQLSIPLSTVYRLLRILSFAELVARILERGKRGRPHARWFPCNGNKETVSEDIEREIGYCLRVRQLEQLIRERPGLTAEEYAQQHPTPKSTIYSMLHFLLLARLIVKAMTDGSRGRPLTRWYPSVNK